MSTSLETPTSLERMGFLPIAVDTITTSVALPFDLFLRVDPVAPPVLYREHQLALESHDLERFASQDINTLYIRVDDHSAYRQFLVDTVLHNDEVPTPKRFRILQTVNKAVFEMAFSSRNAEQLVRFANDYGEELVTIVSDETLAGNELLGLMAHDYYTYTHATNVSVLALLIAQKVGMGVTDGIVALATGAVLHDLGKRQIAPALLNEKRRLTKQQFEAIQEHPKLGFLEVAKRQDVLWGQLMMIYQHHEHWDGRGYPVGATGDEIHPWARMCAVADVYDATSSARPYRVGMPIKAVWEILDNGSGQHFDPEFVKALKSVVPPC